MGCIQSSSDEQKKSSSTNNKGAVIVDGNAPAATGASATAPDPRLPLNARQKYSMLASWKGIARALEPTGVYMFIKLFEEHGDLLALFTKFQSLKTRDEQANSSELAAHASSVMNTLDESIRSLDSMDTFFLYVQEIGARHSKIDGFKKEYFSKIRSPFLDAVKMTLGDRYTENIEAIYNQVIDLVIKTLIQGYEDGNAQLAANPPS